MGVEAAVPLEQQSCNGCSRRKQALLLSRCCCGSTDDAGLGSRLDAHTRMYSRGLRTPCRNQQAAH